MSSTALQKREASAVASQALTAEAGADALESLIAEGDLARLSPAQRVAYYRHVCESVGLNAFTRPFEYIRLSGKLTLYARKDATDQLRKIHGVSITRIEREHDEEDGLYIVTAYAESADGRADVDIGAVPITQATRGEALANARMKAMTKAKRRVTLSICGLGWLDETELETIPRGRRGAEGVVVNHETGEIVEAETTPRPANGQDQASTAAPPEDYKTRALKCYEWLIALPAEALEAARERAEAEVAGWPNAVRTLGERAVAGASKRRAELEKKIEHLGPNLRRHLSEGIVPGQLRAQLAEQTASWPAWWRERAEAVCEAVIAASAQPYAGGKAPEPALKKRQEA